MELDRPRAREGVATTSPAIAILLPMLSLVVVNRYLTVIENGTATHARSPSASGARLATKGTR